MVKWVYDHTLILPSLTSISPSLTSILPSLRSFPDCFILPASQCRRGLQETGASHRCLHWDAGRIKQSVKLLNDSKMLVNDGEMLVNDGKMSVWSYTHFTIINEHPTIISLNKPLFALLTIIEKLHLLYSSFHNSLPFYSVHCTLHCRELLSGLLGCGMDL